MSYISLYRKYRPKTFSDVVGQDVIVEILKNSIINDKLSHAYIFSGPRGTGKTSIAKIFSKAVNCLNNKNGDLCCECDVCNNSFEEERVYFVGFDEKKGYDVAIVSGDRDLLQVTSDKICVTMPRTKAGKTEIEKFYAKDVEEKILNLLYICFEINVCNSDMTLS